MITPAPLSRKRRSWGRAAAGIFSAVILYVATYALLSTTGGWVVTESGENRMGVGLATADVFLWQPRYGSFQRFRSIGGDFTFRGDTLGYLFGPLILLDQRRFHPTIRFMNPGFQMIEPLPAPPLSEYHPLRSNRWHGRFPYESR